MVLLSHVHFDTWRICFGIRNKEEMPLFLRKKKNWSHRAAGWVTFPRWVVSPPPRWHGTCIPDSRVLHCSVCLLQRKLRVKSRLCLDGREFTPHEQPYFSALDRHVSPTFLPDEVTLTVTLVIPEGRSPVANVFLQGQGVCFYGVACPFWPPGVSKCPCYQSFTDDGTHE